MRGNLVTSVKDKILERIISRIFQLAILFILGMQLSVFNGVVNIYKTSFKYILVHFSWYNRQLLFFFFVV